MKLVKRLLWCVLGAYSLVPVSAGSSRTKVIDFESSLVEGINRQPYDSLNSVSDEAKRRKRSHLYRKRGGFSSDTRETLSEMRFLQ